MLHITGFDSGGLYIVVRKCTYINNKYLIRVDGDSKNVSLLRDNTDDITGCEDICLSDGCGCDIMFHP